MLDADDAYEPSRLERLGDLAAARPDLDMLGTDCWFERRGAAQGTYFGANVDYQFIVGSPPSPLKC